jgi:hypothetical protein
VSSMGVAKPKTASSKKAPLNKASFSKFISTFELKELDEGHFDLEVQNVNGEKKKPDLTKLEEYEEYVRYAFQNPFVNSSHILNLYVFKRLKPILVDAKDGGSLESEISDLYIDLAILMDSATKKTIHSKGSFYLKDTLVAEGSINGNANIKIVDDLSRKIKNLKLQQVRVTQDMLGTDKRSLNMELQVAQAGKQINQKLNVNLLNMKQTPVKKIEDEFEEMDQELDSELDKQSE